MKKLTAPKLIVGSSNNCADVFYATGFKVPDPIVLLAVGRRRYLVVPEMEWGRAHAECAGFNIFTPERLRLRRNQRRRLSWWAVGLLRTLGVRRVAVPGNFPLAVARKLEQRRVRVAVVEGPFFPSRQVKSAGEIKKLHDVQEATVRAMREAVAAIAEARVGAQGYLRQGNAILTSERLRTSINKRLLDDQCAGGEPIVACGAEAADPHAVGHGPLRQGEPIVIDIFPQHLETGYWGDLTRTVVKGVPQAKIAGMYRAVRAAQNAALRSIRPGVQGAQVHRLVEQEFERRGFPKETINEQPAGFIHGTGHGIGLEVHEAPSLGKSDQILRAGNVVTVEPGLYYPGVGGVRVEDAVVVTPRGFSYLAQCEKDLVVR